MSRTAQGSKRVSDGESEFMGTLLDAKDPERKRRRRVVPRVLDSTANINKGGTPVGEGENVSRGGRKGDWVASWGGCRDGGNRLYVEERIGRP